MIKNFNLRVYAIISVDDKILLSDENINGFSFTKFPGGGVEKGEGLLNALKRELKEEGNIEIEEIEHFYTTDFFQVSAFNPEDQIISVYYKVKSDIFWNQYQSDQSSLDKKHIVKLKFYNKNELNENIFTFPIDKLVWKMLK